MRALNFRAAAGTAAAVAVFAAVATTPTATAGTERFDAQCYAISNWPTFAPADHVAVVTPEHPWYWDVTNPGSITNRADGHATFLPNGRVTVTCNRPVSPGDFWEPGTSIETVGCYAVRGWITPSGTTADDIYRGTAKIVRKDDTVRVTCRLEYSETVFNSF